MAAERQTVGSWRENSMPDTGQLMDTLVKLASLGTSGICIFAIFWIGWLISRPEVSRSAERQRTLRSFMVFCIVILVVSAGGGLWNDKQQIFSLKKQINEYETGKEQYETTRQQYTVRGIVRKDDGSDPGDVTIYTRYPPVSPDGNGNIIGLRVKREEDGTFPSLGVTCPGFAVIAVDLNLEEQAGHVTNNVINLSPIDLHKIPMK
jgi:hypothetical protein